MSPRSRGTAPAALVALALLACGFANGASTLDPAGIQAARLRGIFSIYFTVCAVVFAFVIVMLGLALARRMETRRHPAGPPGESPEVDRGLDRFVAIALIVSAVALLGLLVADFATRGALRALEHHETVSVQVTGHQWWWEFQYVEPAAPSRNVTTANELHLPVGRVVRLDLRSADVIHSFWVPALHGKTDLVPGYPTSTWIRADRAGTFAGECAEFCGHQHATMRFVVVAEPEPDFERWLDAQRRPAPEPVSAGALRGRTVFLSTNCVMCHAVAGTAAGATIGPDLTHLASRATIASGTLPNTRGALAGWIVDPQRVRPGVLMPANPLPPADLQALLDYLETLR